MLANLYLFAYRWSIVKMKCPTAGIHGRCLKLKYMRIHSKGLLSAVFLEYLILNNHCFVIPSPMHEHCFFVSIFTFFFVIVYSVFSTDCKFKRRDPITSFSYCIFNIPFIIAISLAPVHANIHLFRTHAASSSFNDAISNFSMKSVNSNRTFWLFYIVEAASKVVPVAYKASQSIGVKQTRVCW